MSFTENDMIVNRKAYYEGYYDENDQWFLSFTINNEDATEEEYLEAIDDIEEESGEYPTWFEFTEENIDSVFQNEVEPSSSQTYEQSINNTIIEFKDSFMEEFIRDTIKKQPEI